MSLPFSREQFFAVMAAYNEALWPAPWLLGALAVVMVALVLVAPARAGRPVATGLALLWAWVALAYHLAFFWRINPAAPLFAALSLAATAAFAWRGAWQGRLRFPAARTARSRIGLALILFALAVYPLIGYAIGHRYPAMPTFGLPCPLTLFTFGLLLMATPGLPRALVPAPLLWAVIGATAAFALGVTQDLALLAAVAAGLYLLLERRP